MISTFLAGRISEEMFLNSKTASGIYDLASARQTAADMVIKFGMGETSAITVLSAEGYTYLSEYQAPVRYLTLFKAKI